MKIINKKPFYFGTILLLAQIFVNIVPRTAVQRGNIFDDWYGQLIILALWISLVFYWMYPESLLGRLWEKVFNLYSWVWSKHKK